jgi:biopolymer transport protein ExbD
MGMSAPSKGGSRAVPFINVTPLIDVLLVLLIIFMVVTPLKPSRFKALAPTPPDPNQPPPDVANNLTLQVAILPDYKIQLNTKDMGSVNDTGALAATLNQTFKERERLGTVKFGTNEIEKTVFIKAPKSIKYGEVVKVIDAVKGAGANPVGLQLDELDK